MGSNEWMVLSVDGMSIWEESQSRHRRIQNRTSRAGDGSLLFKSGTEMWRAFPDMIDLSESRAAERLPAGQLDFHVRGLEVWAADNLYIHPKNDAPSSSDSILNDCSDQIGPGPLVRATSPPTNDMLLYDAEFLRCTILVLEDTP